MQKLIDLIPYRLRSEPVADYENAIQPSIDALEAAFWGMTENIVVDTAEDWLPLWEWAYGLTGSGSVEARRSAVKAKMRGAGTTTLDRIQAVADAYANAGATVWEDNPAYMFYIRLNLTGDTVPDIPGLRRVLEEIKPAHLGYGISVMQHIGSSGRVYAGVRHTVGVQLTVGPYLVRDIRAEGKVTASGWVKLGITTTIKEA